MGRTDAIKSFSGASTKTDSITLLSRRDISTLPWKCPVGPNLILGGGRPVVRFRFDGAQVGASLLPAWLCGRQGAPGAELLLDGQPLG
jgi:hypothetical protein